MRHVLKKFYKVFPLQSGEDSLTIAIHPSRLKQTKRLDFTAPIGWSLLVDGQQLNLLRLINHLTQDNNNTTIMVAKISTNLVVSISGSTDDLQRILISLKPCVDRVLLQAFELNYQSYVNMEPFARRSFWRDRPVSPSNTQEEVQVVFDEYFQQQAPDLPAAGGDSGGPSNPGSTFSSRASSPGATPEKGDGSTARCEQFGSWEKHRMPLPPGVAVNLNPFIWSQPSGPEQPDATVHVVDMQQRSTLSVG